MEEIHQDKPLGSQVEAERGGINRLNHGSSALRYESNSLIIMALGALSELSDPALSVPNPP